VDILIGTHRLLSKDVEFKDLGLLIIDEEHRFGVAQKEKIKSYRALVDVLTLTATPIPRTLQLALSGIRDLSLISTPPPERHAVHNYLIYFNPEEIKTAIQEELSRGGQVFFVHNRVRSIGGIRQFLEKILPGVPVGVAHGQMNAKELEEVMIKFLNREINILLCTAIIGSGLDIPSANTILINRADRFGLADLYQLRGRVGRGKEMAYCYFIIPKESPFSAGAVERLRAIKTLADLGSGYRLAVNDLEIRGAGEIFGPHQSGHIEAVGYDLYLEMLEREINQLKAGEELPPLEPEIRVSPPAFIPEDYLEFPEERLEFYRRLSLARDDEELQGLELELQDRFGELPGEVANLFLTLALKLRLRTLRVKRMEEDTRNLFLWFDDSTPVSPEILFELVQSSGKKARLTPEGKLTYPLRSEKAPEQLGEIKGILDGIISKIKMKKD
jgi:transcription-repair coupling factor (superfamily II helicase)